MPPPKTLHHEDAVSETPPYRHRNADERKFHAVKPDRTPLLSSNSRWVTIDSRACSSAAMESKRLPSKHSNDNREKRVKRKEILEKKKAIDECIKSASADKDPLASFPPFRSYNRNGLSVHFKAQCGDRLSLAIKQYIMSLLKDNMEEPYGSDWPTEEKVKRREMVIPEARYIFVHETPNECSYRTERERTYTNCIEDKGHIVGFVHYRFTLEEEIPVLYVYELQLEPRVQAKGLGKFLMQLIELVAHKNHMGAVMLTVQKANSLAMNFYLNKLRYVIAAVSPSRVDPLMGVEKRYEILCKTFDHEAKAILEIGDIAQK